ncbi:MAG: hypothetical protein JNL30_19435 [Rubrivivax sp.]|nr:hypothetical protein [Rubrivivax sp.]
MPPDTASLGSALEGWLRRLAEHGFRIGPRERVSVQALLLHWTAQQAGKPDVAAALGLLGPLLCTGREQQARYRLLLQEHLAELQPERRGLLQRLQHRHGEAGRAGPGATGDAAARRRRRRLAVALLLVAVTAAGLGPWISSQWPDTAVGPVAPAPTPAPSPVPPPAPSPALPWYVLPLPLPEPPPPVASPTGEALRAVVLGTAAASLALLAAAAWRARRRSMVLRQTRSDEEVRHHLLRDPTPVSVAPHAVLARNVARALRQRGAGEAQALDIKATIDATVAARGALNPRWRALQRMPEYLALVDERHPADHLSALAQAWLAALDRAGVVCQVFFFDGTPAAGCWPRTRAATADPLQRRPVGLAELATRAAGRRLLVFADAHVAIDRRSGRAHAWLQLLRPLAERAWFTPAPMAQWGRAEDAADAAGFTVLPLQEPALHTLAQALTGAPLTLQLDADSPGALPVALRGASLGFVDADEPPPAAARLELLQQLRGWLGAMRFQWLAACALFPQLTPPLTLALGQQVLGGRVADVQRTLALGMGSFAALPWFRHGRMPDWLREDLQAQLSPVQLQELETVVRDRLDAALGHAAGAPLAEVSTRVSAWLRRGTGAAQDLLLADFLQRKDRLTRLLQKLPDGLRRRLFRHGRPGLGLQAHWFAVPVALGLAGGLAATPLWNRVAPAQAQSALPLLASWSVLPIPKDTEAAPVLAFLGEWQVRVQTTAGPARVWDLPGDADWIPPNTSPPPREAPRDDPRFVAGPQLAPNGGRLEVNAGAAFLSRGLASTLGRAPLSLAPGQSVRTIAFTPSGRRVVALMSDDTIRVWGLPRFEFVLLECPLQSTAGMAARVQMVRALQDERLAREFDAKRSSFEYVGMTEAMWQELHPTARWLLTPGEVLVGTAMDVAVARALLPGGATAVQRDEALRNTAVTSDCVAGREPQPSPENAPVIDGLGAAEQAALSARVARLFGPSRDDRVAATRDLVVDAEALSDAIAFALPQALRIARPSRIPMTDQRASGVINTLELLRAATPATLRRYREQIAELLPLAEAMGSQTLERVQPVRAAVTAAAAAQRRPQLEIIFDSPPQEPVASALASTLAATLSSSLVAAQGDVVGVNSRMAAPADGAAPPGTTLRSMGASDRALARALAAGASARVGPVTTAAGSRAAVSNDTYQLRLPPDLCVTRATAACPATDFPATRGALQVTISGASEEVSFTIRKGLDELGYERVGVVGASDRTPPYTDATLRWNEAPVAFVEEIARVVERAAGIPRSAIRVLKTIRVERSRVAVEIGGGQAPRAAGLALVARSDQLLAARAGVAYRPQRLVSGGTPPYEMIFPNAQAAVALPDGMMIGRDGVLSGTPRQPGRYRIELSFRDAGGAEVTYLGDLAVLERQSAAK